MYRPIALAIASALMLMTGARALSQDKTPPPAATKVLLDNEKMKVVEVRYKPGAVNKMQARPPRAIYYFTDSREKITTADGKTMERNLKAGEAVWRDQETTEVTNGGKKDVRLIVIAPK
jgi:beta-alanine degradation protein BauB